MQFMKRILFLFIILILSKNSNSQDRVLDSLKKVIQSTTSDTVRVNTQLAISRSLWIVRNLDTAMIYGEAALQLAKKVDFKKGIAVANNNMGVIFMFKGDYSKAQEFFMVANKLFQEIGNRKKVADTYNNLGETSRYMGNYPKALEFHYSALKMREVLKDSNGIAMSLNNIGLIQEKQSNLTAALKSYFTCLKIYERISGKAEIARTYNNIAEVYRLQKRLQKALDYQTIALRFRKEVNDMVGIAMSSNNIGGIKYDMAKAAGKRRDKIAEGKLYDEALQSFLESKEIMKNTGDNYFIATTDMNIGNIYVFQKKYIEAESIFLNALDLSKKMGNKDCIKLVYGSMSDMYRNLGKFEQAYKTFQLHVAYRDSLQNEETNKKTIETQLSYEFDKKEAIAKAEQKQKDLLNEKEKQSQRWILYAVIIGLVLVLVFSVFMYSRFKITNRQKKIIELKEQETQKQNEIITQQKHLVEEKHKEITDSINYAERIQRSFLATEELLNENLKDHFVFFQPKDIVSGDFYWATKLSNNNFALVTADSTGHGVPGAIMSLLNVTSLESAIKDGYTQPCDILNATRKTIIDRLKKDGSKEGGKDGMDASLISFDFLNNKFVYSAANNPVWVVRKNELIELKADKMPIGKHDKDSEPFTQKEFLLQKDDVVYTLTDGFSDQFGGPNGKKFMYKQLKELLIGIAPLPMKEQQNVLSTSLNTWKGNLEQVDDVCVIGVRV
jgi:serine phosphatase RsbU (regulator of sigma subunit)